MTRKSNLITLLIESLKSLGFKSVDLLERFTYDREDLPVCVVKENSTEINISSSECWEHHCDLSISIIDLTPNYDLTQEVLQIIKAIPRDTYIFELKNTTLESKFEDTPYHQITLNLEVKYYSEDFSL